MQGLNEQVKKEKMNLADFFRKLAGKKMTSKDIKEVIKELSAEQEKMEKEEELEREKSSSTVEKKPRKSSKKKKEATEQASSQDLEEQGLLSNEEKENLDNIVELPLDYDNLFSSVDKESVKVNTVSDGLVASLNLYGKVDIEYIASASQKTTNEVVEELKGSIFQNPNTWEGDFVKGWETADEYLSGNLVKKWREAKKASIIHHGFFDDNVRAIEEIIPPAIATKDIYVTLGSPWIPTYYIDEFIDYLFGRTYFSGREAFAVKHDEMTGTWDIPEKNRYYNSAKVYSTYGTRSMPALYILEKTLNMRNVVVTEEVPCATNKSGVRRAIKRC